MTKARKKKKKKVRRVGKLVCVGEPWGVERGFEWRGRGGGVDKHKQDLDGGGASFFFFSSWLPGGLVIAWRGP